MLANITKRCLSFLLVMVMALSMLPISAFAAQEEDYSTTDAEVFVDETVLETVRNAAMEVAQTWTEAEQVTEEEPEQTTEQHQRPPKRTQTVGEDHTHTLAASEAIPALCEDPGLTAGIYCLECNETISGCEVIPPLGHNVIQHEAKLPTFSKPGWEAYEECSRCAYTTYQEIPKLVSPVIEDYGTFIMSVFYLEELANTYALEHPGKDPLELMIKYIRTGVDRYNSGSWGIMAGYEDVDFANFVAEVEDMLNSQVGSIEEMFCLTSLKNIENFYLPNGELTDIGHMFGTMDITYHNQFGTNHADVGGWAGDLVDLLEFADFGGVSGTLEEMVKTISEEYFLVAHNMEVGSFSEQDLIGDLDAMYLMNQIKAEGYHYEIEVSGLAVNLMMYFTEDLSMEDRADYFLRNRLDGVSTRGDVREAVYNAYTTNKVISTLEGTREFTSSDLETLRKAVCYAYADYICKLAGDYVENSGNDLFTVFSAESNNLAPGIHQQTKMATTADGKQIVYYLATGDLTRDDVTVYANYHNNDPTQGWEMQRVLEQAVAAEERHSNPENDLYIENYNVIAAVNGAGFNMSTGQPSGLLVMEGVEYSPIDGAGFFGILKDGTPVIGSTEEYKTIYKDQVRDGIACFGSRLIKDGKVLEGLTDERASRTAVGITKTGKVVFLVLDGRQEPFSCGGGYATLAQILLEAGCVEATNLDGGGSTTFVAQMPGDEDLSVVNRPSDGFARSVSTSLIMVSTAPSSTAFDHAVIESNYDYLTAGTSLQMSAVGISPSGNAVEIPDGAYWAISDDACGRITEDGMFTALDCGTVNVYLMVDDVVVGAKTLQIVQPDNLYFTKTSIDTVYGATTQLPLKLLYLGKDVAFNANDVLLVVGNKKAGSVSGLNFTATGDEASGITNTLITAALINNSSVTASIRVALYKQGELTFDFEQATGGDRQFAWHRVVSNSETDDNSKYVVVNPADPMTTSYVLAIDMNHIPIPGHLDELTYMLPGADLEGANAWTFLCQLAERISAMTEINATVSYDPNFDMDISELKVINNYFTLTNVVHDEENCTLTLTLKWKKQTQAIDIDSANPMCIVNGITLTPKADAQWSSTNELKSVITGEIGYVIYMRASALYSFANKPENQEYFGLYSYINPDDSYDKGGYFADTYKEFADSYTLVNDVKSGWHTEEGGFSYYVEGVKLTGVHKVDGLYYNFGDSGFLAVKTPYSGLFVEDGKTYYAKLGEPVKGWHNIGEDWYLFNWQTAVGEHGTYHTAIDGVDVTYEFENGKLVKGYWLESEQGRTYYYGPYRYNSGWRVIDGESYFFNNYLAATGVYPVRAAHAVKAIWYEFTETGELIGEAKDGLYWYEGKLFYVENTSSVHQGLYLIDGNYYCFQGDYSAVVDCSYWVSRTNGLLTAGTYRFDADGKIIMGTEIVEENGELYYYCNGKRTASAGLVLWGGAYYHIDSAAKAQRNVTVWVSKTNGLKPVGSYSFDGNGHMIILNGIVDGYYYVDGTKTSAGLIKVDGNYYYAEGGGKLVTDRVYWISRTNDLLSAGSYRFDVDGKIVMTTELVNENGTLYYYKDGKRTGNAGVLLIDGDYYYVEGGAIAVCGRTCWVSNTNGFVSAGTYRFGADGKMIMTTEVVDEDGELYYYQNGKRTTSAGLVMQDGAYYHIDGAAKAQKNVTVWVSRTNGLIPAGTYSFGADGKMIIYDGVVNGYYYVDGIKTAAGLIFVDGSYYYAQYGGKLVTDKAFWISSTNGMLTAGTYRFDADGKIIMTTELTEENGILYYYENGRRINNAGLLRIDGDYYYVGSGAIAICGQSYWISKTNGLLAEGTYRFDAEGKLIMFTGLVDEQGQLYYYRNGKRTTSAGIIEFEGAYYYIDGSATAQRDVTVWINNTNGLWPVGSYTFGADGKMIIYDGVVNGYYYVDGIKTAAGLIFVDGSYYYAQYGGKLVTDTVYWISSTNGLLTAGSYRFDAEGKIIMTTELVDEDGTLYYYKDGKRTANVGLIEVDGSYYYIESGAIAITNQRYWVSKTNGLVDVGVYEFGADGKMILP